MKKDLLIFVFIAMLPYSVSAQLSGRWILSDMHKHTSSSDGSGTAISAATAWKNVGFNYLLITDHNTYGEWDNGNIAAANAQHDPSEFRVALSMEWSKACHFNTMFLNPPNTPFPLSSSDPFWSSRGVSSSSFEGILEVIQYVDSLGGWMQVNHPGGPGMSYNAYTADFDMFLTMVEQGLRGFEAFNGANDKLWNQAYHVWRVGGFWDEVLKRGHRFWALSGTDSHGGVYNGSGGNRVYILENTITDEAYLEALKAGRFYMVADFHSGAPFGIQMNVTAGDSMMGSTVTAQGGQADIHVQANVDSEYVADLGKLVLKIDMIKVVSGGEAIWTGLPSKKHFDSTFSVPVTQNTYVRVEVTAKNLTNSSTIRALSNPIFLEPANTTLTASSCSQPEPVFSAYPNPFRTSVAIMAGMKNAKIQIYDVKGNLVKSTIAAPTTHWHAVGQPAGVYIVKVKTGSRIHSKKIILAK
jgi:hypothetical protein